VTICGNNVATPSIVVNICGEGEPEKKPGRMLQTRCPDRNITIEN
jgi:hypothetical protein